MLAIWLGASVSLHATVLVLVPAVAPTGAPPGASRLEVLILPPTLLPVAASDPAPLPPASNKLEPQHAPAAAEA
ncbi:MAG: hypothetical protein ACRET3_05690, partial [Burkholderiales bacterium]